MKNERSFRQEARLAKQRIKNGFWTQCKENLDKNLEKARLQGFNESKAERYFATKISEKIAKKAEKGREKDLTAPFILAIIWW